MSNGPAYVALLSAGSSSGLTRENVPGATAACQSKRGGRSTRRVSRRGARCARAPRGTRRRAGEPDHAPAGRARDPRCDRRSRGRSRRSRTPTGGRPAAARTAATCWSGVPGESLGSGSPVTSRHMPVATSRRLRRVTGVHVGGILDRIAPRERAGRGPRSRSTGCPASDIRPGSWTHPPRRPARGRWLGGMPRSRLALLVLALAVLLVPAGSADAKQRHRHAHHRAVAACTASHAEVRAAAIRRARNATLCLLNRVRARHGLRAAPS